MRMRNFQSRIRQYSAASKLGLFSRSASLPHIVHSIVGEDKEILATHMKFISIDKVAKADLVSGILAEYPNCHLTLMSPAIKRECDAYIGAMIQPGHIHSTCTDDHGKIIPDGDASFTIDNSKKQNMVRSVPDSRLTGYQSKSTSQGQCRFSSTVEEIQKWVKISDAHSDYPLYVLAIPFCSREERDRYLSIAETNKERNKEKSYSLFSHYCNQTLEVIRAYNCVTFNAAMNEDYFNEFIFLGDNPSPQLAYIKLANAIFSNRSGIIQKIIVDDILTDKEHFEADFHRFGVV